MSDIEKQKLFMHYKLPALAAVLVILLVIVSAYNNRGQSNKLQAENNKLITQIEELTSTTQRLNKQNGDLVALAKKIGDQEKTSAELSSDINQMTASRKAASAALAYIERKLKKAKKQLQTIQESISTKTAELADLPNGDLGAVAQKIEKLEKKYIELNSTVEQMEAKKKAAATALAYIERKVGRAKTKLDAIQDNISTKATELSGLQNKADALQQQVVAITHDLEQLQVAQDEKNKKSETLYKEVWLRHETLSQEIITLEKAIVSKTAVLDSLELLNRMHPVIEKSIQVMTQDAQKKEIAQQARLEALRGIIAEANANLIAQQEKFAALSEKLDTQDQMFKVTKHIRDDE